MAHSGRERHRDRDAGRRQLDEGEPVPPNRVFRLTDTARQEIASCLRRIDGARQAIESQHRVENRAIVRDLRACADEIYEILNELECIDD